MEMPPDVPRNLVVTTDGGGTVVRRSAPSETAWRSAEAVRFPAVQDLTDGRACGLRARAVCYLPVKVRPEQAAYRFAEGAANAGVTIVAGSNGRPTAGFAVSVSSRAVAGGAASPGDYRAMSIMLFFDPADFSVVGEVWQARKTVALTIVDDNADEDDEEFQVWLERSPGRPIWLRFQEADGTTACPADICVVTVTISDNDSVPSAPQNLVATPGDGEVVLTWKAPADDGGSAVTGYWHRYAEGASVPSDTGWTSVGTALTVTVRSLTNGTAYAFEVRAANGVGSGAAASGTATPKAEPDMPQNLVATPGDGEVVLTWEAPADDGGSAIGDYQYRYAEGGSIPEATAWVSVGAVLTATVEGLADGTAYTFQVRAVNDVGYGGSVETGTTVLELPLLSVENARAAERTDPVIGFTVTLSRSSTRIVTVDYTTADGSAKAAEDYETTAGTLLFAAAETGKTVSVPLLRDARDEGEESFSFSLSNARNARIGKARAIGAIANDGGALPGAWLLRFGRTVAQQVVDAVGARLEESPQDHATVGGMPVPLAAAGAAPHAPLAAAAEPLRLPGPGLPLGSSFHLSSPEAGEGRVFSLWGRIAADGFDARVGDVRMDGDVTTGLLAADSDWGRMTLGAAVAHSDGRGTFAYGGPRASRRARGKVRSEVTGIYPYARLRLGETASIWGLAGRATGRLTLTEDGGAPIRTGTELTLGALGAHKTLSTASETGGIALSLKSDAFWVRTSSEAVRSAATGNLAASEGEATRVRLALQGERPVSLGDGQTLVPTLFLGGRWDGGDAETGLGLEVGGGIAWSDAASGISASLDARRLVTHEAQGFRDWGVSGTIRFDPTPSSERGFALSLASSAGAAAAGGATALLGAATVTELSERGAPASGGRMSAEVAYGTPLLGGRLTAAPFAGIGLAGSGRDYTLGWRLRDERSGHAALALSVAATRSEYADGRTGHGASVTLSFRW